MYLILHFKEFNIFSMLLSSTTLWSKIVSAKLLSWAILITLLRPGLFPKQISSCHNKSLKMISKGLNLLRDATWFKLSGIVFCKLTQAIAYNKLWWSIAFLKYAKGFLFIDKVRAQRNQRAFHSKSQIINSCFTMNDQNRRRWSYPLWMPNGKV